MHVGDLREIVLVQRATRLPDGLGGAVLSWSTLLERRASVWPVSGRERALADQIAGAATYRITVRRDGGTAGIMESDRIIWAGRTMNIRFIGRVPPAAEFMTIDAEMGVP